MHIASLKFPKRFRSPSTSPGVERKRPKHEEKTEKVAINNAFIAESAVGEVTNRCLRFAAIAISTKINEASRLKVTPKVLSEAFSKKLCIATDKGIVFLSECTSYNKVKCNIEKKSIELKLEVLWKNRYWKNRYIDSEDSKSYPINVGIYDTERFLPLLPEYIWSQAISSLSDSEADESSENPYNRSYVNESPEDSRNCNYIRI